MSHLAHNLIMSGMVRVDVPHSGVNAVRAGADWQSMCPQPTQSVLKYNMSNIDTFGLIIPVPADESLTDAICCDKNFLPFAEPQYTFQRGDVNLFAKMNPAGTTIFYDSICGQPLFEVP